MTEVAIQDKANPNISRMGEVTIIKIPSLGSDAELRFNFGLGPQGVELAGRMSEQEERKHGFPANSIGSVNGKTGGASKSDWERVVYSGFKSLSPNDRQAVEHLLDETINHPSAPLKAKQDEFNALLIATQKKNHSSPLDVGTSDALTPLLAGGALLEKTDGQPVLGVNLQAMNHAIYMNKDHQTVDFDWHEIVRHELFHYIDPAASNQVNGNVNSETKAEQRAVWFVNQFRELEGKDLRASYLVPVVGGVPLSDISVDQSLLGGRMPGSKPPALENLRAYPPVISEEKDRRLQVGASLDDRQFPGIAAIARASEIFLKNESGLPASVQADIQSYVAANLEEARAGGKDVPQEILERKTVVANESHRDVEAGPA